MWLTLAVSGEKWAPKKLSKLFSKEICGEKEMKSHRGGKKVCTTDKKQNLPKKILTKKRGVGGGVFEKKIVPGYS